MSYDCFISHTKDDRQFAVDLSRFLESQGLKTFLAELSLEPGSNWSDQIRQAHRDSKWILFLASKAACASPRVQHEVGGAVFAGKELIPIVWDMDPSMLPGWAAEYQALDLRAMDSQQVLAAMERLAQEFRSEKAKGQMIGLGVLAALALILLSNN